MAANQECILKGADLIYFTFLLTLLSIIYRHDVESNVKRIPGASVIRCPTEEQALTEFENAVNNGTAVQVTLTDTSRYLNISELGSLPMGTIRTFPAAFFMGKILIWLFETAQDTIPSRRWYSVTVGRFPGVYNGP